MARRFLLDTHVVIDLGTPGAFESMPRKVRQIIENPDFDLLLSVVSAAEIAIKNGIGKLAIEREDLDLICTNASITLYPLQPQHSAKFFGLPLHHKDPFDRLIIATALSDDLPVISIDGDFRKYK